MVLDPCIPSTAIKKQDVILLVDTVIETFRPCKFAAMDDWDAVLDVEAQGAQRGYEQGRLDAGSESYEEGQVFGQAQGIDLGRILGFAEATLALVELHRVDSLPRVVADLQRELAEFDVSRFESVDKVQTTTQRILVLAQRLQRTLPHPQTLRSQSTTASANGSGSSARLQDVVGNVDLSF